MRICDNRYSRDRQRLDLALHFIENEARTQTIRIWTGLSDDRIRKLYRSYLAGGTRRGPVRHRGKSPQQCDYFTRTQRLRSETSLLASLLAILGALPRTPLPDPRRQLPGVGRGTLLCHAYEMYCHMTGAPHISFEHAVLLLMRLGCHEELRLGNCPGCGAQIVGERYTLAAPNCPHCTGSARDEFAAPVPRQSGSLRT